MHSAAHAYNHQRALLRFRYRKKSCVLLQPTDPFQEYESEREENGSCPTLPCVPLLHFWIVADEII